MNAREIYVIVASSIGALGFVVAFVDDLVQLRHVHAGDRLAATNGERQQVSGIIVRTLRLRAAGSVVAILGAGAMVGVLWNDADLIGGRQSDLDRDFELAFVFFATLIAGTGIATAAVSWRNLRARKRLERNPEP